MTITATGIELRADAGVSQPRVLTDAALGFLAELHGRFEARRAALLTARSDRQRALDAGADLDFPTCTADPRAADWTVAATPPDLADRRVEITGPAEPKMMINALNSGARVFMADFEDALSPTWANLVGGQAALIDAVRHQLEFRSPEGKEYRLAEQVATLIVRPRGWHLDEQHVWFDGAPISASLFDAGLYLWHNAAERVARGTGAYFYLPKLESAAEAALWADVFAYAEERLGLARGSIRVTVLIETISAAFEMDEILHALRHHIAGLNAGRWDYIFSLIKRFPERREMVLPDRAQVTMAVPFMRAYTQLMVKTCHQRGAHAIGGMAAFIPNRNEPDVTRQALAKVTEDKEREAGDGFDGTWVAHPDLVPVAMAVFDRQLGDRPNQLEVMREDVRVSGRELLDVASAGGQISESGVRTNIRVALRYLDSWLDGTGAAAIDNLMEDAATAEISRSQLWSWLHHGVTLAEGHTFDQVLYRHMRDEEFERLRDTERGHLGEAAELLDQVVLAADIAPFMTTLAYPRLG